jgi:hypothetical protein
VADTLARTGVGEGIAAALDQVRKIARQDDRRRVIRMVRTTLRDANANCSEIAVVPSAGAG